MQSSLSLSLSQLDEMQREMPNQSRLGSSPRCAKLQWKPNAPELASSRRTVLASSLTLK